MAVIEAKRPDGKVVDVVEVNLTQSGLLLMITDNDAHQVLIHTSVWDELVKAVQGLFDEEKRQAQEWLRTHCSECSSQEQVTKFVDTSRRKPPVYLCAKCYYAGYGSDFLEEVSKE